ncbi:DUF4232 domain-containing protein [Streptomyces sp. NPDC018610]|jgi:hypothetical protein|uniref:DUF4232 domain-containing protein n=1 Tax=Streptomyces sp. NPDC018610 TaxID=3365049 RepID=UPI00378E5ABF
MSARTTRSRTARTTRTRLFAATALSLAALSLTACNGTDAIGAGSSSPVAAQGGQSSGTTSAQDGTGSAARTTGGTADTTGSKGSTATTGSTGSQGSAASTGSRSGGNGSTGGTGAATGGSGGSQAAGRSSGLPGKCGAKSVRIRATVVSRPLNHLLLTATNTGSKTCMLPPYPMARFGEAQAVPPVAEDTKPQSLTGLAPGESGYAGVLLSAGDGSAAHGHTVHTLTVPFDDGSIATVALPAKGVYVDDSLTVTYWQASLDLALDH